MRIMERPKADHAVALWLDVMTLLLLLLRTSNNVLARIFGSRLISEAKRVCPPPPYAGHVPNDHEIEPLFLPMAVIDSGWGP